MTLTPGVRLRASACARAIMMLADRERVRGISVGNANQLEPDEPSSPVMGRIAGAMLAVPAVLTLVALILFDVAIYLMINWLEPNNPKHHAEVFTLMTSVTAVVGFFLLVMIACGWRIARGKSGRSGSVVPLALVAAVALVGAGVLARRDVEVGVIIGGCAAYFIIVALLAIVGRPGYRAWRARKQS